MNRFQFKIATLLLLVIATGCQSFSSTSLSRMENNSFSGDSNGLEKRLGKTRPFKGVPITLQIPTHVDVFIEEIYYLNLNGIQASECLLDGGDSSRLLNVKTEIIKSDKIFTVDFKRPGSGTLGLGLDFNDEQYFNQIDSKLVDTTIKDAAALAAQTIDSVGAIVGRSTSANQPSTEEIALLREKDIVRDTRTVAYMRFDINAVDFELQLEQFVNRHLNSCNQCGQPPTYDSALPISP